MCIVLVNPIFQPFSVTRILWTFLMRRVWQKVASKAGWLVAGVRDDISRSAQALASRSAQALASRSAPGS